MCGAQRLGRETAAKAYCGLTCHIYVVVIRAPIDLKHPAIKRNANLTIGPRNTGLGGGSDNRARRRAAGARYPDTALPDPQTYPLRRRNFRKADIDPRGK